MAGIGFRLQKLLSGDSYLDLVKAYLLSSVIATGPTLVVIGTLAIVKATIQERLNIEDGHLFLGIIVYVYAFSMIGVGPILYLVTRYLADKHYIRHIQVLTPTYLSVLAVLFAVQGVVALIFLYFLPVAFGLKWVILPLYLVVNGIWVAMVFISAARSYYWIFTAFAAGAAVGIASAFFLGSRQGLAGFFGGYTLGQATTFFILTWRVFAEFGFERASDFGFVYYIAKFPHLVAIGIFYYLGIWIDKMVFWSSPHAMEILGVIRIYSDYDSPMFLAYLTVIPSMAYFLIEMETTFFAKYRAYFEAIRHRESLAEIAARRSGMIVFLTQSFVKFAVFQGMLSAIVILLVYKIAEAFSLNPLQMGIFRIGILGSFLQMGFMIVLMIFFYFDFQKDACIVTFLFLAANGLFTLATLHIGLPAYGYGFTAACFVSLLVAFLMLNHKLTHLDYWTFMRQPVILPKFKLEVESKK